MLTREQLETVVAKKKVQEVRDWFEKHFQVDVNEYAHRCPFLDIQGPTGCGKTETLKCVARELSIPVIEYSETTDITDIDVNLDHRQETSLAKRRAIRFEHFVINHLRFNPLFPSASADDLPAEDSEFDTDDEDTRPPPGPVVKNCIILVEAPLVFLKSYKIIASLMTRLIRTIKDMATRNERRVAIVFESLDSERDTLSIKFKKENEMHTIKFNPITSTNMKKFIKQRLSDFACDVSMPDKSIELLVSDCDGDLRACSHTLQLLCNRIRSHQSVDLNSIDSLLEKQYSQREYKRPRLDQQIQLNHEHSLLRGVTKSVGFYNMLGKIFYQKRLYPERSCNHTKRYRSVDRPFALENTTEYLATNLEADSKVLLTYLHQHYTHFCSDDLQKAALYTSYLSTIDTISINSTQSTQFYEAHSALDDIQLYLAIEATNFCLYVDQSKKQVKSHKTFVAGKGPFLLKSSAETASKELYHFNKPASLSAYKLTEDYKAILVLCSELITKYSSARPSNINILTDYAPYLSDLHRLKLEEARKKRNSPEKSNGIEMYETHQLVRLIGNLDNEGETDLETRHEQMMTIIDELERRLNLSTSSSKQSSCWSETYN